MLDSDLPPADEIRLLREVVAYYGDRVAMATSCRPDWQQVIDRALGQPGAPASAAAVLTRPDSAESRRQSIGGALIEPLRHILGFMCFELGPVAHVYQRAGEFVGADDEQLGKRAEDEQAFMLNKLLGLWIEHGAGWPDAMQADLDRVKTVASQAASG